MNLSVTDDKKQPRAPARGFALALGLTLTVLTSHAAATTPAAPPFERTEQRPACADHDPLRQPFVGDLHVHTGLSLDAATQGTRSRPRDAYRFARGEEIGLQPWTPEGKALRHARIDRPLDFAAVTDHSEFLGELRTCTTEGLPGYKWPACVLFRRWPALAFFVLNSPVSDRESPQRSKFCGDEGRDCKLAAAAPWGEIRDAAEEAYDRSAACTFTSFIGYEWTAAPLGRNLHRNVIFRGSSVPDLPVSALDVGPVRDLWSGLDRVCRKEQGCEWLAIPHNSNLSSGLLFLPEQDDGEAFTEAYVQARARAEPLVEVTQHKGDSECRLGVGTEDEACTFEQLPYDNFSAKFSSFDAGTGKNEPTSFVRNALHQGLALEKKFGTNPFRFGLIGSTDTHLGTPGLVQERGHQGHGGAGTPNSVRMPIGLPDDVEFSPGGLAVLWAEENSRDALFAAMRRREAYSTSGPRMVVRFFGGFDLPTDICQRSDLVATGYARGVPMGGVLQAPPSPAPGEAPRFVVSALRDAGTTAVPGAPLERIQIIKGWLEGDTLREEVVDLVDAPGAQLDTGSCTVSGGGATALCQVWTDPDFDPAVKAVYYARVLEVPTCRWTTFLCNDAGVRCDEPATIGEGFAECCDDAFPRSIQERALTSPIWLDPRGKM